MRERVSFDYFVIPFLIGMTFVLAYFAIWIYKSIRSLRPEERKALWKSLFSKKIFTTIYEILMECLIHRKIWKKNPVLGYMHSSIAFGWFMLIVLGHIEVYLYTPESVNLYYPIFFRYFVLQVSESLRGAVFFFLMDLFLLIVLSGIFLAMYKRVNSRLMGMKHTTKQSIGDRFAMYSMWSIFICRLLAESFTSEISGGSFLTRDFGQVFSSFVSNYAFIKPCWWAYSTVLGIFMVSLPFSRYMHIPTEAFLILLRNAGIKSSSHNKGYASFELYSCPRCGVCIDPCQMVSSAKKVESASVYSLRNMRNNKPEAILSANDCMMCMRCVNACPVGIDSCRLKQKLRAKLIVNGPKDYSYLKPQSTAQTEVLYFAGCMGHLTPSVPKAMIKIMKASGENFDFMDKNGSICCGRPLMLAGQEEAAKTLMAKNIDIIKSSGAHTLVTSCPICYRIFKEDYNLDIRVLHHTEYIDELLTLGKIQVFRMPLKVTYHDPCELGRGSHIYEAPRRVLRHVVQIAPIDQEREHGLCCGGSVGSLTLSLQQRQQITKDALAELTVNNPDILATACPLCQKTFSSHIGSKVKDIAQIIADALDSDSNLL